MQRAVRGTEQIREPSGTDEAMSDEQTSKPSPLSDRIAEAVDRLAGVVYDAHDLCTCEP